MKNILFFIENLDIGGAERALAVLAENLDKNKYSVHVATVTDGELYTDRVKACCHYTCFTKKPASKRNFIKKYWNMAIVKFSCSAPLPLVYRLFIHKTYDIEIAFCEGYATRFIASSNNKSSRKIAWLHTDVINHPWSEKVYSSPAEEAECYRSYDTVCCVSRQVMLAAEEKFGLEGNARVLYNPINENELKTKSREHLALKPVGDFRIITAGRLSPEKAFDRLVRIAKKLKEDHYRFEILILGKGEEQDNLNTLIKQCEVSEYVKLPGYKDNPYNYIAASDFFVCSSLAEGFSTIATECVLLNKPVITTDCAGMGELFGSLACGIICENNEAALYKSIKYVFDNPKCLTEFSGNCAKRAKMFTLKNSIEQIEKILDE